jgi:hypothetical protein
MTRKWSKWRRFPDPRKFELLTAPFGPGCYEFRDGAQLVLYGMGSQVAIRMGSLCQLPSAVVHETTKTSGNMSLTISTALNIELTPAPRAMKPKNVSAS